MADASEPESTGAWVGRSLLRKEDRRHLAGASTFVADLRLPRMRDVAFVRSPAAHGRVVSIEKPTGRENSVFTLEDLQPLNPISGGPEIATFRNATYPPLADAKVLFVGQTVAMCIGSNRAGAEDLATEVNVEIDELEAVVDAIDALSDKAPLLHDGWPDNSFIDATISEGEIAAVRDAPVKIRRQLKMNRQATNPLETRGVVAYRDHRLDELVVYSSTQGPHVMRHGLSLALGIPEHKIRVVAPDVGGGFGGKNRLMPEEIAIAALAMKVDHPVRWIEDRNEHLVASIQAREHHYDLTLYSTTEGRVLGIEGSVHVDAGAFALWPSGPFMETGMAARNLPGSYTVEHLHISTHTVATNKAPIGPYRGVARPGACFAIERMIDELADEIGCCPVEIRRRNLVQPTMMPYRTAGGLRLDNGDYPKALAHALEMIDLPRLRERQRKGEPDGRKLGVGFAVYTEQSGHGTQEWVKRKSRVVPGFESATIRMLPDGTVHLLVGIQSHGQGLETSLSQIAAQELGIDPYAILVRHGDTGLSPQGFGTFASRSIVFSGGAVAKASRALASKIKAIGAQLLQVQALDVTLRDGAAHSSSGQIPIADIARAANIRPELLPAGTAPGLEATETYEPPESGGVFSYGVHAVTLLSHPITGVTEIIDYVIVEDCGNLVNPMIVDGQIIGGVAQGIGTALYEELHFDENGQPTATTYGEYMIPCAPEIPNFRIKHMVTPAESTEFGVKGMGEGGAIAPPAAIANALNDAHRNCKAKFLVTPMTPRRVSDTVADALTRENAG
ncbi:xanthine dehydrogenase family protein molybdopterin-binding subunit (plasmid) [Rhizobium sp. TRM96647]|uniref:xanthine dehydrogenase family protein molybdopterin-binding subunit n=1 Tax=unclassified Rhizobium TaxID=2613769 RepID=UPI0021E77D5F|nr:MULTISPECIES: xanthine dehydrogenase family protein molybdopterin-binding subunit [unclassified Rhizobium]MCV3735193.1 xanthine dehydrogenase family protein molybdopterin-binding subunit [Rhizobium sp. TRM96647]MCV3758044.1 xanthine dehydrogenase family protein molybdopterin-binding subunit [Rhizobium sp. TRM96650]